MRKRRFVLVPIALGVSACVGTYGNTVYLRANCPTVTFGFVEEGLEGTIQVLEMDGGEGSVTTTTDTQWIRFVHPVTGEEVEFVDMADAEVDRNNEYFADISALCE